MDNKVSCRCGKRVDELTSYFQKGSGIRITVCDSCATELGLNDSNKFDKVKYIELTKEQNKTPDPNVVK